MPLECNRSHMTRLVDALESGQFEQGRSRLRGDGDAYCCLGVACDISGQGQWMRAEGGGWNYVTHNGYNEFVMPAAVADWLGLGQRDDQGDDQRLALPLPTARRWPESTEWGCGTAMNDTGASFADIAAAIRRDYLTDEFAA